MGFLVGSSKSTASQAPVALSALRVQTSVYGLVLPIQYGTNRLTGNLIDYTDFLATAHTSAAASASGGKGGGGNASNGTTSYTYSATVLIGLCEGPIFTIGTVWQAKAITSLSALGLSLFTGTYPQSPWWFLSTNHPERALGYNGLAYLAGANYQLDTSASMQNNSFEVWGQFLYNIGAGIIDANPKDIVTDLLTNPYYGSTLPVASLGDLTQYSNYCIANGFFISPAYDSQTNINQSLDDLARLTNSAWVWSSGKLTLIPYGDAAISGNGVTYTPNLTPLFDLTDDDFQYSSGNDPVEMSRTSAADAYNSIKIEIVDRNNAYNTLPIEAKDQAAIEAYGLRQDASITAHGITLASVGQQMAQLILQRSLYVRNTYAFKLGWKYGVLDPMDIVTLTDAGLGLNRQLVRVISIDEDNQGLLSVVAEQIDVGVAAPAIYGSQSGSGTNQNLNAAPGNVNVPVLFEPPDALAGGLQVWAAVSGGSNWGGCDVWVSSDGDTYRKIGTINGGARQGLLSATLPTGIATDQTNTLSVDLTESNGQLLSGTIADANALNTICYVDGELVAYETAALTAQNKYNLTYLVRGAYGTTIKSHAKGSQFARLDQAIFQIPFNQDQIGTPLYLKFTSFNTFGVATQSLADVSAYSYTLQGSALASPLPDITNLTSAYVAGMTQLQWTGVKDFRPVDNEIRLGPSWATAQFMGRSASPVFPPLAGDGTYWVAAHSQPANGLHVYSANPQSIAIQGATLVRNVVKTYDEQALAWPGTLSGAIQVTGSNIVTTGGGNFLGYSDFLGTSDFLFTGGGVSSGIYTAPETINTGRPAASFVTITFAAQGAAIHGDFLSTPDFLGMSDMVGGALSANINVQPQIRTSNDNVTWSAWQNYQPGQYNAQYFQARLLVASNDAQTQAIVTAFKWTVDMPDRVDVYQNVSIPAGGLSLTYQPLGAASPAAFNGGPGGNPGTPGLPAVQVTWLNTSGDTLSITSETLSGCTIQILNGGVGVARTAKTITAQGY